MRQAEIMRTTIDIEEDVLGAAKDLAAQRNQITGKVISDLLRLALQSRPSVPKRNGIRLLNRPAGSKPITLDEVNRLRDE